MQTDNKDDDLKFSEWSQAWQIQPVDHELNFARARRQQTRRRWVFYMDLLQALLMFVAGFFFFWLPLSVPTLIGAPVLIASACLVFWGAFKIHRQVINYADWSSHGVLTFRHLNSLSSINHLKLNQLGCLIVSVFALMMVLLSLWIPGSVPSILVTIYAALLPAIILLIWWLQRRINCHRVIIKQIEELLNAFEGV